MVVGDAHVFPGFLTPVLTLISFQSHRQLFSYASAEMRGKNMFGRNFALTGSKIHGHQVVRSTPSPLSHRGGTSFKQSFLSYKNLGLCGYGLMLSAICFSLDQYKILLTGNGLNITLNLSADP